MQKHEDSSCLPKLKSCFYNLYGNINGLYVTIIRCQTGKQTTTTTMPDIFTSTLLSTKVGKVEVSNEKSNWHEKYQMMWDGLQGLVKVTAMQAANPPVKKPLALAFRLWLLEAECKGIGETSLATDAAVVILIFGLDFGGIRLSVDGRWRSEAHKKSKVRVIGEWLPWPAGVPQTAPSLLIFQRL